MISEKIGRIQQLEGPRLVSVIIPALNAESTIGEQLEALLSQTYTGSWEVIVSDNGSSDNTRRIVENYQKLIRQLRVVDSSAVGGPSYARNAAAGHAEGDFLAFCDADDVVSSEWLENLVTVARTADLVGGPLVPITGRTKASEQQEGERMPSSLRRPYNYLPGAPSGNLGIWASVFTKLDGFTEELTSGEDWDLSWRAQSAGYSLDFARRALVYRRERKTLRRISSQYFKWGYGTVELAKRHPGAIDTSFDALASRVFWIVTRLPYIVLTEHRRRVWIQGASFSTGLVVGVIRNRR